MAIKARVLYFSSKGKIAAMADLLSAEFETKSDTIPPAYPCENLKLLIIGITPGKELANPVRLFCEQLSKQRAQNVALFVDGKAGDADSLITSLQKGGTNIIRNIFYCSGGLPFKFAKSVSPKEKSAILAWYKTVLEEISK